LTVGEAATVLGVPEGTVKSRCHHARLRLRRLLESTYGEPHAEPAPD
jgi:DNA-directed RNA polymerase specialized sigma24 family protein